MSCCLHFSYIRLKFHALLGFTDSDSVTKHYRDAVHYINPIYSDALHCIH